MSTINILSLNFDNSYARLPQSFYSLQKPVSVRNPQLVLFNASLAEALGLSYQQNNKTLIAKQLSGNETPPGAEPLAQAYAGHQFGHFTKLGDGRAILLGEHITPGGKRFDIQLKGSGQTPYSRRGDGRATLRSMLREYLISEAMHGLGIPTSRSLAVVSTGEPVYREVMHEGAILTRIMSSHIRVGTFEYVNRFCSTEELKQFTDYVINRHYPAIAATENPPLELLKAVAEKQIELIINWLRVGFIHGVMNTDNTSISGETFDYGPCAFMNKFDPAAVFSSIDTNGRYAYLNQPSIIFWNLGVLADALLPLLDEDKNRGIDMANGVLHSLEKTFTDHWYAMMFAKVGIAEATDADRPLIDDLLQMMYDTGADYTQTFYDLRSTLLPDNPLFQQKSFQLWFLWRNKLISGIEGGRETALTLMQNNNPVYIPRNYWVEQALDEAIAGDFSLFNDLLGVMQKPCEQHPGREKFSQNPTGYDERGYQTFCGT
jgi:serine/tyrosine/threonine adenylyltransferase